MNNKHLTFLFVYFVVLDDSFETNNLFKIYFLIQISKNKIIEIKKHLF